MFFEEKSGYFPPLFWQIWEQGGEITYGTEVMYMRVVVWDPAWGGGSMNIVVRRFDGVGPWTASFIGFRRLIPYFWAEKNPDQKKSKFLEKSGFRFSKCSKTIDLLRIYYGFP